MTDVMMITGTVGSDLESNTVTNRETRHSQERSPTFFTFSTLTLRKGSMTTLPIFFRSINLPMALLTYGTSKHRSDEQLRTAFFSYLFKSEDGVDDGLDLAFLVQDKDLVHGIRERTTCLIRSSLN